MKRLINSLLGALPLPAGERVGVRGSRSFNSCSEHPSPDALRASTSPLRGEVKGTPSLLRRVLAHPLEFALALVLALTPLGGAFANPLNGQVAAGQATIAGQGTASVTIKLLSQSNIINWNTFNIAHGELTQFIQPNASSVALNRVTGGLGPSPIYGTITANGRLYLGNPDGILFGMGSRVDAAGFLASTNDIKDSDFMSGRYRFNIPGRLDASIVNFGHITATNGGFAALVAPGVRNAGVITANLGHVALASGNGFTLDFYGDKLITLQVGDAIANQVIDVATGQPLAALVQNEGKLRANGGTVALTAAAARTVVDLVINNTGVIEANSVGTRNGMIVLGGATASTKGAGAPTQKVVVSGTLSAKGTKAGQKGGMIVITGESIALTGAKINASGTAGGGTVLIGGDTGGGHLSAAVASIPQAQLQHWPVAIASMVTIDQASVINASATRNGNGGKVVVWSNGLTTVAGLIRASGGRFGGNGGFVETSGQSVNFDGIRVNTSAPNGHAGLWLVDPMNLVVDANAAATISSNLVGGNVSLVPDGENASGPGNAVAGAGDIIINSIAWSSGYTLTLTAYNGITVNAPITIQARSTSDGCSCWRLPNSVPLISFGTGGSVQFTNTPGGGQSLVINKQSYTLLSQTSATQGINNNGDSLAGFYALAKPLDAGGVTSWTPIGTDGVGNINGNGGNGFVFYVFQGLGNTISNSRSICRHQTTLDSSLCRYNGSTRTLDWLVAISSAAILLAVSLIQLRRHHQPILSTRKRRHVRWPHRNEQRRRSQPVLRDRRGGTDYVGGLVGFNGGSVMQSHATGAVNGWSVVGGFGLVDNSLGTIAQSYATGQVQATAGGNVVSRGRH